MRSIVLSAYLELVRFDLYLARGNFRSLYDRVHTYRVGEKRSSVAADRICAAVDLACIWYRKETSCLHRSAATACLLKRHGVPAQMVIGVQQMPFKSHAWVEVEGCVVNDRPYTAEMYVILDRC